MIASLTVVAVLFTSGHAAEVAVSTKPPLVDSAGHTAKPQSAYAFYEPIRPVSRRPKNWPDKLGFEPVLSMSLDEFESLLTAWSWEVMYSCGGKPLTAEEIHAAKFHDGYISPSLRLDYGENGMAIRSTHRSGKDLESSVLQLDEFRSRREGSRYRIEPRGKGQFKIFFQDFYAPELYQLGRVPETNELILRNTDSTFDIQFNKSGCYSMLIRRPVS